MTAFNPEDLPADNNNDPNAFSYFPKELRNELMQRSTVRTYDKREILLQGYDYSTDAYFIVKGLIMCYVQSGEKNTIKWIRGEGGYAFAQKDTNATLILTKQFTGQIMVALEETTVIKISFTDLKWLQEHFDQFGGLIQSYMTTHASLWPDDEWLTKKEKYRRFQQHAGFKLERVPDVYLSSWLGMTLAELKEVRNSIF